MNIQILYFDGCPTYREVERSLRELVGELGIKAEIGLLNVETDEQAQAERFTGSPTVRVEGKELIPPPPGAPYQRTCRIFEWEGKMHGAPPKEMLRGALEALAQSGGF